LSGELRHQKYEKPQRHIADLLRICACGGGVRGGECFSETKDEAKERADAGRGGEEGFGEHNDEAQRSCFQHDGDQKRHFAQEDIVKEQIKLAFSRAEGTDE